VHQAELASPQWRARSRQFVQHVEGESSRLVEKATPMQQVFHRQHRQSLSYSGVPMALEQELAYFERHLDEWLPIYRGQFVVIKGDELLGSFSTFEEALKAGVGKYGTDAFLIREVSPEAPAAYHPALTVGGLFAHL